jgi:hypothetical protein
MSASEQSLEMSYEDENILITQKMIADFFNVDGHTINEHIQKGLYRFGSLRICNYLEFSDSSNRGHTTSQLQRETLQPANDYYREFQGRFRRCCRISQLANQIAKDYTIQGLAMDKERLINGGSVLTHQ